MEGNFSTMRVHTALGSKAVRILAGVRVSLAALLMLPCLFPIVRGLQTKAYADQGAAAGYVGSQVCGKCHPSIYESFSRTDMGRSMAEITPSLVERLPTSAHIFDPRLNRHFELYARDGRLYQSEYETNSEGREVFRETQKLEWIIGSGANGSGAIVRRGDYLFEAPLSYYTKIPGWALSPGYEFGDYGFNRPILPGCISCHSGQPQPIWDGNGRFRQPPFTELAIGCENCHGPGQSHVAAVQMGSALGSITNPAKLSPWLGDNICMSCHQTGDARVLQAGKTDRNFHPGAALDDTLSIFLVPFARESVPKDDLLEHYLSMRLSKCYLKSGGRLSCTTCHNPHVQPSPQEVPAYFRQRCMTCHTEKSCALPLSVRQHQTPPDDCAGCHMPKRDVKVISHSVLTNHRIVAVAEEPFPEAAFHMTTAELPDLVHLSVDLAKPHLPPPLTVLQAYAQIILAHPEYREHYWSVAKQLEATQPENVVVLEALADWAMQKKNAEGKSLAIRYLQAAIQRGATNPPDFEQLASLLVTSHRESDALGVLQQGIQQVPYDVALYRLSARVYFSLGQNQQGCELVANATQKFPQDDGIRSWSERCPATPRLSD
jgi:Doubled CXXCH motif (Paired_CXXCH_1)